MRLSRTSLAAMLAAATLCSPAFAQGTTEGAAKGATANGAAAAPAAQPGQDAQAAPSGAADPVVAKVGDHEIHRSDLEALAGSLPPQMRGMSGTVLYPMLLNQMIDREALVIQARKDGLDKDKDVQRAMQRADDLVLQNALLRREVIPQVTDAAVKAEYEKDYANKPGAEEVHAEHILVPTEEQAKKIIAELDKGAKFEDLAKKYSTDPSAKESGGDLGYFKKDDMVPAFADVAFKLKPGEITQTPVHTQFGWHVIKVLDRRVAPPPKLDEVKDEIQKKLVQQAVQKAVEKARAGLTIERFNPDGSPLKPTGTAEPAAPKAAPSPAPAH